MYPLSIYINYNYIHNHHIQYANPLSTYSSHAVQCMITSSVLMSMVCLVIQSPAVFTSILSTTIIICTLIWPSMHQMPQDQYHDQLHFKLLNAHFNVHYPDITIAIDIQFKKINSCFQLRSKNTCVHCRASLHWAYVTLTIV